MQEAIVAIVVVAASWAIIRRYTPQPLRQACRAWAVRTTQRLGWHMLEKRLSASAAADASCADGCGPCKGCGPEAIPRNRFVITFDDLKTKK